EAKNAPLCLILDTSALIGTDILLTTFKRAEVLHVVHQNCLDRHSPGVVLHVRQRQGTGSISAAQRLPSEPISAGAMGREGVWRFHKARRSVRVSDSSGCRIYHSSPHSSDRRKHHCRERELVARYGSSVQP